MTLSTITTTQAHDDARRDMLHAAGIDTAVTKVGRCALRECNESHPVHATSYWVNFTTGAPVVQWKGTHHGATYVYESFMVTRDAS
jgi:hypothetical protein